MDVSGPAAFGDMAAGAPTLGMLGMHGMGLNVPAGGPGGSTAGQSTAYNFGCVAVVEPGETTSILRFLDGADNPTNLACGDCDLDGAIGFDLLAGGAAARARDTAVACDLFWSASRLAFK
jgi:hypothetical protein